MINKKNLLLFLLLAPILLLSCSGRQHLSGFDLMNEIEDYGDSVKKSIYITSTLPIDSADQSKIIFDIWRHDIKEYPREVKLMARVYDSSGHFITNMANPYLKDTTQKFFKKLTEKLGKVITRAPVVIDSFVVREFGAGDSIPYNIALSIDYSGSMSQMMETIYEGTDIFINLKMKYDRIGINSFNTELTEKVPMTQDKNKILTIFNNNKKDGFGLFSAVNDAVMGTLKQFDGTDKEVPRVLVVFTDADENYSKTKIGDLIEQAKKMDIHIFAVAFGYSKDENLRYMAKYTGGKFYKAYSKEELINIFRDIYMSLRYYYQITYKPPQFWGLHKVYADMLLTKRPDTLTAYDEYDTSNMYPWDSIGSVFERPILFDFNMATLKAESVPTITEVVDQMLANPKLKLEIQGHTDNVGGIDFNQTLSEKRARVVMEEMIKQGVEPKRLRSRGFGLSMPVAPNDTDAGRAKNRRTEFHILAK
jgi:outer membrane protein OmpA-like peptidoglycan-associated protein